LHCACSVTRGVLLLVRPSHSPPCMAPWAPAVAGGLGPRVADSDAIADDRASGPVAGMPNAVGG